MCVLYGRGVQANENEARSMGAVPAAVMSGGVGGGGCGTDSSGSGASARVCCVVYLVLTVLTAALSFRSCVWVLTAALSFRSCVCLVWSWCAGKRE